MDEMDTLGILIQAILSLKNPEKSKQQILADLPELQKQLNSDKNARINIVAGLDIKKSAQLIQANLNTLVGKANAPVIELGVNVGKHNIEKVINNELSGVSKTSQVVSDEIVKSFNNAFSISKKISKEARSEIKSALQDTTNSWNTGDIDKYTVSMKRLMDLANRYGKAIKNSNSEIQESISQLRASMSDGSKVFINKDIQSELKGYNIQSILSNVYGVGKWTFDSSKSHIGADKAMSENFHKQFGSIKEAILYVDEAISKVQSSGSTVINNMSAEMSDLNIEDYIRKILRLSDVTKQLTFDPNLGGALINLESDFDEVQSKAQQTGDTINKSLSGKYFSDNENIINDIKLFKQEEDAILRLTEVFNEYGATVSSVEHRDSDGQIKGFTLSVKSAAGTIEDFNYKPESAKFKTHQ